MNFSEAMNYMEEKNKLGQRPGLDSIRELLHRLGNPQNKVKCLHIAGTNGKGSVFAFVQSVLLEAGYHTGRYISPTVFTYLERYQIDGKYIDEETFTGIFTVVRDKVEEMVREGYTSPTAFEIETAVAFMLFYEQRVDFALVECGMGGLLDATNVIASPYMTVMTQISMDHMQFLGNSPEEIAAQKAGIIKENSVCVSALQKKEVQEVLENTCRSRNTTFFVVKKAEINVISMTVEGSSFKYKGDEYIISLPGDFQIINAATAIEVCLQIKEKTDIYGGDVKKIDYELIKKAMAKTIWPGRFTVVNKNPYVIVDGAHNEQAWLCLRSSLEKYFTNKKFIYIIGVLKDKEYVKMADILCDTMKYAITITPQNARGLDNRVLSQLIASKNVATECAKENREALKRAYEIAEENDVIVVCGSLSFIGWYMRDINYGE